MRRTLQAVLTAYGLAAELIPKGNEDNAGSVLVTAVDCALWDLFSCGTGSPLVTRRDVGDGAGRAARRM
jgi:L-alanine-DL-glutamate epimerase-like enolase superfamily enzyme